VGESFPRTRQDFGHARTRVAERSALSAASHRMRWAAAAPY